MGSIPNLINRILGRNRQEDRQQNTVSIKAGGDVSAQNVVGGDLFQHNLYQCEAPPDFISNLAGSITADLGKFLDKSIASIGEDAVVSTDVSLKH
jgi:hypothetical protein